MAASGGGVPQLGGHDYEFVREVPDKWTCLICQLTLKEPMQIMGCGHRLCKLCVDEVMRRPEPACPADRKPLTREKLFPDAGCEREIQDLDVKCPIQDCSWTGELRGVEAHEKDCPEGQVSCDNARCKEKIKRKDAPAHMSNTCEWRIMQCRYCPDNLPFCQLRVHHDALCKRYPLSCENECGAANIPREEMDHHLTECLMTAVPCDYQHLGCQACFPRTRMDAHQDSSLKRHLDLACLRLEQQQKRIEEQERKREEQERRMEALDKKMAAQDKKMAEQDKKMAEQDKKMAEQLRKIEEADNNIRALQDRFATSPKGTMVDANLDLVLTKTASSEPFHLGGYKMMLVFSQRSRNVRVGIRYTLGKFDDQLEWPLHLKASVSLMVGVNLCEREEKKIIIQEVIQRSSLDKADVKYYDAKFRVNQIPNEFEFAVTKTY